MKKRLLVSTFAFTVFALVGPLVWLTCPPAVRSGYRYIDKEVFSLIVLTFPTILFSAGKPTPALVSLVEANIAFYAVVGALVGLFVRQITSAVVMYFLMCLLLAGLEAYYVGFELSDFQWFAFGAALLLYAVPFGAVFRHVKRSSGAGTGRVVAST